MNETNGAAVRDETWRAQVTSNDTLPVVAPIDTEAMFADWIAQRDRIVTALTQRRAALVTLLAEVDAQLACMASTRPTVRLAHSPSGRMGRPCDPTSMSGRIREALSDGPMSRKDLVARFGAGAIGALDSLRGRKHIVLTSRGVYRLASKP